MAEEEEVELPPILVVAPVAWGIPDDPNAIIQCSTCGADCWMSVPMTRMYEENSQSELICAPCYMRDHAPTALDEDVLDVSTNKPLSPYERRLIERGTRRRMRE